MSDIGLIVEAFLELLKLLKRDKAEEFKKHWAEDEAKFIQAWKTGDATIMNALFDKYYHLLDILS